ncbi:dinitrogenase iron-molybdenum cofactor biosynthesis protein [Chlorobium phaeovibrioides]|uniref:Dinitrogenase iron-molybdenum cofactor biosynthesis protein n=2 Tax=Chlorobium phaeovibrioides TaxID=1094 RepID=A0A3S0L2K0_CHLPH|nr:NifB/NifX family molybdenum-iron cluster-binding protein [Chlorobium phaeovibrioides]HCD35607.1 dinitrogenase iron-molybdenum cofactor biosynthesis protein [Chlorobium sp.]KAA6232361.1 dinitrogenase iron-molybdenum cofactor biosynthesis protein [Chlorobium phaeovibrioides]MWV54108.1 dinitrogenase iron-molybdenum cofactor biosynthesis protein [Chlorobium phaeovibrioides]QEQ57134.1 dinitrogenase iron-molybdenum cofactor biosynthesis protein [Chlorobium phaeovibrioides]RTY35103.1 dinitrogenase
MKVVIPLDDNAGEQSVVCEHFGSAPWFAISNTETGEVQITENPNSQHVHGQCTPAEAFIEMGVNAVICNGIGARAAARLQELGIDVFMADMAPTLGVALRRFAGGDLVKVTAEQACQGHDCH